MAPRRRAHGAFARPSERGREALAGLELADSITLDPHKWLYQPIELGALFVRRLPRPCRPRRARGRRVSGARADDAGVARHRHVPPPPARPRRRGRARAHQREPRRPDRAAGRRLRLDRPRAGRFVLRRPRDGAARAAQGLPGAGARLLRRPTLDAEALRSLALFSTLDDEQADAVLAAAHEHPATGAPASRAHAPRR